MARPLWTGSISFGLVNVAVQAVSAVSDHDIHFHRLDKSGARVRNKTVSEKSGREVDADDIEMGFELSKDRYVTFTKEELRELRPASTRAIEITDFVELAAIDPIYYERTYWLVPNGDDARKPYGLLLAAMEARERAAIGTVVIRNKQYLAAVRPLDGALAMSTMRFADEVVPRNQIEGLPSRSASKPDAKSLRMAEQLVEALAADWDPGQYKDTYVDELRKRILEREEKGDAVVEPDGADADDADTSAKILDLTAALQASVDAARGRSPKKPVGAKAAKPAKKPAAKKPAAKKAGAKKSAKRKAS